MRGTLLDDRYLVGEELGTGATATVYRAHDRALGRDVAIKLVQRTAGEAERRFAREVALHARFRHPGAVEVYATGQWSGAPYLVLEYIAAPTLETVLEAGPLPVESAMLVGQQLAEVLEAAHRRGLVHRDVKPANLFAIGTPITRVRLADFGLAFARTPERATHGRITVEGTTLGTPLYMAPEQIEDGDVGPPADIYATCALLYEAIAGRPPFTGDTVPAILAAHLYLPPIALAELELASPVPAALEAAILAGLAKRPEQRPTALELGARLHELPVVRGGRTRMSLEPAARHRPRAPVTVWTADAALADALAKADVRVDRACDVELFVVGDQMPAASATPSIVLCATPTPAWVASAIRAGHAAAGRWPASIDAIVRLATQFAPARGEP